MNKKALSILIIVLLVIALILIMIFVFDIGRPQPIDTSITSFEDCIQAGNPILETYPPQCITADGRTFTSSSATTTVSVSPDGSSSTSLLATSTATSTITNLIAHSVIASPLTITGKAPNTWYFEAVFPIKIVDANGLLVGEAEAQAQSDWMAIGSVPFKATVTFSHSATPNGSVILMNDNPSGDPARSQEVIIPIQFAQ